MADARTGSIGKILGVLFGSDANLPPDTEIKDWEARADEMKENFEWFDGTNLKEVDLSKSDKDGVHPQVYPLGINPVKTGCQLHSYALWGEVPDTADPMTTLVIEHEDDDIADHAERAILEVCYQNNLRVLQQDMGLQSQILGGTVLKVGWENDNLFLPSGVRYEYIDPRDFHCHYSGTDYVNLTEAWVKYVITRDEAKAYGVNLSTPTGTYIEYWNRNHYRITIDGNIITMNGTRMDQDHEWGFVPFIYTPHERAGDFWGMSLVPDVVGLTKEINSRYADMGDAIHLGVHGSLWARNLPNTGASLKTFADGRPYLDAGKALPGQSNPEIGSLPPGTIPESGKFQKTLLDLERISMLTPNIAYGEEEGSQRSGQTLYSRMWPTLAHIRGERTYWTISLNLMAEMTPRLLNYYKRESITDSHLKLKKRQIWAPMVPVDRQQLSDEMINRYRENAISTELMVTRFGDTPDREKEVELIKKQAEERAKQQAMGFQQPFGQGESKDGTQASQPEGNKKVPAKKAEKA